MSDQMITVKMPCTMHGGNVGVRVTRDQLAEWTSNSDRHVQQMFPNLTPAERELFVTSICGPCWDGMFPNLDENAPEFNAIEADPDCND